MAKKIQSVTFILAGGKGTRLAPLSLTTEGKLPKQFLAFAKKRTMLQEAINRVPKDTPIVVVLEERYVEEVKKQSEGKVEVIAEPFGCNTTAAIGLAAVYALHKGYSEKTVLFIMPADHYMDTRCFRKYYDTAIQGAAKNKIVAIGITPDRAATGYGYINANSKMQTIFGKQALYETIAFVEKPDQATAEKYVESKEYFWNAGIFAFTIETILKALEKNSPVIYQAVQNIKEALGQPQEKDVIKQEYQKIKDAKANISIDYAVMEKEAKNMFLLPAEPKLDWNDVGGWVALEKYVKADDADNRGNNKVEFLNCKSNFVMNYRQEQSVQVENLEEMLIIDTDNGLLVCPKLLAQRAKEIIPGLEQKQKEILIDSKDNEINNGTDISIACIGCEQVKIDYTAEKLVIGKVGMESPAAPAPEVTAEEQPEQKAEEKVEEQKEDHSTSSGQEPKVEEKPVEEKKEEIKPEEKPVEEIKEEAVADTATEQQGS